MASLFINCKRYVFHNRSLRVGIDQGDAREGNHEMNPGVITAITTSPANSALETTGTRKRKIKGLNYGISITLKYIRVKIFAPSLFQIGLRWMYGNISNVKS